MISTHDDAYYPLESIEGLFERAQQPKQIVWTETGHVRSRRADLVTEIVGQIELYLDGM